MTCPIPRPGPEHDSTLLRCPKVTRYARDCKRVRALTARIVGNNRLARPEGYSRRGTRGYDDRRQEKEWGRAIPSRGPRFERIQNQRRVKIEGSASGAL